MVKPRTASDTSTTHLEGRRARDRSRMMPNHNRPWGLHANALEQCGAHRRLRDTAQEQWHTVGTPIAGNELDREDLSRRGRSSLCVFGEPCPELDLNQHGVLNPTSTSS